LDILGFQRFHQILYSHLWRSFIAAILFFTAWWRTKSNRLFQPDEAAANAQIDINNNNPAYPIYVFSGNSSKV